MRDIQTRPVGGSSAGIGGQPIPGGAVPEQQPYASVMAEIEKLTIECVERAKYCEGRIAGAKPEGSSSNGAEEGVRLYAQAERLRGSLSYLLGTLNSIARELQ